MFRAIHTNDLVSRRSPFSLQSLQSLVLFSTSRVEADAEESRAPFSHWWSYASGQGYHRGFILCETMMALWHSASGQEGSTTPLDKTVTSSTSH